MQPIKTEPVGIYARFSTDLQDERSIEDQVRRCREYVKQQGGNPDSAQVFPDFAQSGASLERPGFEAMMAAVDAGRIKVIVTEDMSRISRDFADSAQIFKRLQFLKVPLIGVADGIDTSSKHAKLSFTVKSLVADIYLDDLRDKTLRGLEGRALAGFATGNVAYGFHTVPVEEGGRVVGNKIEIHPRESIVIRRIFEECRTGRSYAAIAAGLNRERIPSPRVGSRHKCFGWGASTIRAILYNERYAGVWRFKERQWVKVPGTNRRQPQARNAADVMTMERPELRIIEASVWTEVQARLAAISRNYTRRKREGGIVRKPTVYLLSGLLQCAQCGAPMSISAGSNAAYYRCQGNRTKGTCPNRVSVREDIVRRKVIQGIQDYMLSDEGVAQFRKRVAEELRDYSRNLEARRKERVERLARTEEKIGGLIEFIATGDRSEYVVATLRDLEAFARSEKAALAEIAQEASRPLRLPSIEEVTALATDLEARLTEDPELGREALRRWLHEGRIVVDQGPDGPTAQAELLPLMVLVDGSEKAARKSGGGGGGAAGTRKLEIPGDGSFSRDIKLLSMSSGGRICQCIYAILHDYSAATTTVNRIRRHSSAWGRAPRGCSGFVGLSRVRAALRLSSTSWAMLADAAMNIATLIEIVEEAAAGLSRSVQRYWPVNGRNEVGERNQTMHVAGALLRRDWHCWAEAHSDGATNRRHDLLAWHERTRTLCMIEAKRLYSPDGVAAIAADVQRIASFCPIAHGGPHGLTPEHCFGLITATTWTPKIMQWWQSEVGRRDPWRSGTAAWPDARNRAINAANRGIWRAVCLGTESDRGEADRHHLLYALWSIT